MLDWHNRFLGESFHSTREITFLSCREIRLDLIGCGNTLHIPNSIIINMGVLTGKPIKHLAKKFNGCICKILVAQS